MEETYDNDIGHVSTDATKQVETTKPKLCADTDCGGCGYPITTNYICALDEQWHPECFVCSDCRVPFADGKFYTIDEVQYCEIHFHARRGSLCAECHEPVIGKCVTAMFRKFHPEHFYCTYCLKVLSNTFREDNDKPYCHNCFDKLFS